MTYYEAIEAKPDTTVPGGTIDTAGYRIVWLLASSEFEVVRFLRAAGIHPDTVKPLRPGHTPALRYGLDFDLTTGSNDRTVNTHVCHAFTTVWRGKELVMKCRTCGAIIHEDPGSVGGFYS